MRGRRALALLVLAAAAAALLAVFAIQERTPPRSPTEQVPVIWQTAREAPMHVFHVGEKKIACVECHASPDAAPTEEACAKCHAAETQTAHRGAGDFTTTCLSCHAFGAGGPPKTCNACHASATRVAAAPALEHHAGAELPCGACHSVHGSERAVLSDCTTCHRETSAVHGGFEARAREQGLDASMDLSLDAAVLAFLREAGAPAPHDAATARSRGPFDGGRVASDPRAALPGQVCGACHAPHSGKEAARGTCEGCHVDAHRADRASAGAAPRAPSAVLASRAPAVAPRGPRVAGHEACVTCHEPHRARRVDVRACEGCHADRRAAGQVAGHAACSGCHAPHAPAEAKASCSATCHANVVTLAAPRVAAHASCTSCHDPHRPDASAGQACVRCHESTKPSHPATASAKGAQACTGCHAPHGGRAASPGAAAAAHGPRAPAHGATAAACTSCHTNAKDDRALHAKGTACTSCHAPHAFRLAGAGASLCAGCHAKEAKATTARPGHASCAGCHGAAHAPNAKPACKSCHVEEARTAPAGHASCTSCHEAHSGSLGGRASCTSCHANKATALHANVAQGCATCHRPHGPKGVARPAPCASCHTKPSLQGLHSVAAHASCDTCHSAHAPPRSDRASCTGSCHVDKRNHQPEAKVCKGCHLFRQ